MPSVVGASIFLILKTLRSVDFFAVPIATPVELDKQVSKEIFTATMSIFEVQRDGISDLRDSGKYSDLTLECQDIKFPVHKAIVCMYSPVLRATCDDQSQDSGPSVIKVEGFDPSTLKKMLDFIYCGPYRVQNWGGDGAMDSDCDMDSQYVVPVLDGGARQEVREMSQGDNNPMFKLVRPHILAHSIAQYYGVEPLKKHSQDQISGILQGSWSADGFFPVLKFALESSSDEKLRDTMIWGLIRNIDELSTRDDFERFQMPHQFAIKLLRNMSRHITWLEKCRKLEEEQNYELQVEMEKMRDGVNAAFNIPKCGQCSAGFPCAISCWSYTTGSPPKCSVRCTKCNSIQ